MLGRYSARLAHHIRILERNIEDPHLPRGGDVARRATLLRRKGAGGQRQRSGILKLQQTTGEIGMTVARQVQHERLGDAREPDATGDAAA